MQKQQTLAAPFTLEGKGLHTGLNITATFCPAEPNTGYRFQRTDLEGQPIVDAVADNVAATNRGTVIKKDDIVISTIEHAMAALYCLGIDNCLIQLNAPEIPILDGSALPWVKAIQQAGVVEQNEKRDIFRIMKKYEITDEASGVKLEIFPDDHFSVTTFVDYPSPVLNNQYAVMKDIKDFADQVADTANVIDMGEMAKLANDRGIRIGRNRLFSWLRVMGILMMNNIPYQEYMDRGYFKVKESLYYRDGESKTRQTTYVTGKGQRYIIDRLLRDYASEVYEIA